MEALGNVVEAELHCNGPDIDVELRRVQLVHNEDLMKDLNSVRRSGAYVESSCLDIWCAVQNEVLFKTGRRDVLILSIPASQAVFYDYAGEKEDLDIIAHKWNKSRYSRDLQNVLIPVNLHNQHWCLLIVDLIEMKVFCWDSSLRYDGGKLVKSKKQHLFKFLNGFTGEKKKWELEVVFDEHLPQQTKNDCGIFCIEFMRALIHGYKTPLEVKDHVSQGTMREARQHVLREITEMKILEKSSARAPPEKRRRRKSLKAQESALDEPQSGEE